MIQEILNRTISDIRFDARSRVAAFFRIGDGRFHVAPLFDLKCATEKFMYPLLRLRCFTYSR